MYGNKLEPAALKKSIVFLISKHSRLDAQDITSAARLRRGDEAVLESVGVGNEEAPEEACGRSCTRRRCKK